MTGLFGKIDPSKKVNVGLLVVISLVPFLCIYSFLRVKKFKKMLAVNAVTIIAFIMYLILRYDLANQLQQVLEAVQWLNYVILPAVDGFFVWKWSKDYNRKIDIKNLIS